jgi:outer membrane protein assembly factor BamB
MNLVGGLASALLAATLTALTATAVAAVPTAPRDNDDAVAPLGSADFRPTPDHPIGWRGDGTGRYPAADPPLEWFRRPKGAFHSLRVQAVRPKTDAPGGQPLNMGTIREWLVAGPLDAKDYGAALEETDGIDEAALRPTLGDQTRGKPWKPMRVSLAKQSQSWSRLVLDLALAYGREDKQSWQNHAGTLEPLVAYACAYLYAAEEGKVRLRIEATKAKAWLNGRPLKIPADPYEAAPVAELRHGWNRLLVKVASSQENWHMSTLISPPAETGYETKNILWMTPMPGPSWGSPIIVGPQIFVNADEGTLLCVNKQDGRVLWTRSATFYHALPAKDRGKFSAVAAKARQLDELMDTLPADLNAAVSVDGSQAESNSALQAKIKQKIELERDIRETMGKTDRAFKTWNNDRGWTTPTPVSDGKHVYVAFYGGIKGIGANVVACYALDGKCRWSHFTGQTEIGEHGQHATPALSGDRLVHLSGSTLFAYEKATGRIAWQQPARPFVVTGASPLALKAGGVDMVLLPQLGIFRTADGAQLWKSSVTNEINTPVPVGNVVCGISDATAASLYAMKILPPAGDVLKPEFLFNIPWQDVGLKLPGTFTNGMIGSPLYHEGLLYLVSQGGVLTVVDARTGKAVYSQVLESLEPRLTWVFHVGICTGPTLAGKYIHIRDDQSQTLVIAPGRQYEQLAKNVLWELHDGNQQEAQSNPCYEGGRIYYRTQGYLYCIGSTAPR